MRGVYEASIHIAGLNGLKTLILLEVPAGKTLEILSASVTNATNNTNQQLEAGFYNVTTLGSPAGTSVTPWQNEQGDAASSVTVLANLTAEPTTYNATSFAGMGFASLAGWQYQPVPEERLIMSPSKNWGLRLTDTAPTAFDCDARVSWREIG
jgi:hypothetical protein